MNVFNVFFAFWSAPTVWLSSGNGLTNGLFGDVNGFVSVNGGCDTTSCSFGFGDDIRVVESLDSFVNWKSK